MARLRGSSPWRTSSGGLRHRCRGNAALSRRRELSAPRAYERTWVSKSRSINGLVRSTRGVRLRVQRSSASLRRAARPRPMPTFRCRHTYGSCRLILCHSQGRDSKWQISLPSVRTCDPSPNVLWRHKTFSSTWLKSFFAPKKLQQGGIHI